MLAEAIERTDKSFPALGRGKAMGLRRCGEHDPLPAPPPGVAIACALDLRSKVFCSRYRGCACGWIDPALPCHQRVAISPQIVMDLSDGNAWGPFSWPTTPTLGRIARRTLRTPLAFPAAEIAGR